MYKYLGYDLFKKVGVQIQSHQLSADLMAPRTTATLMLGIFLYTKYVQPETRKAVSLQQKDTAIFVKLLLKSRQLQSKATKYLTLFGIFTCLNSFYITKQKYWIFGAISFASIVLFDSLCLKKIQKILDDILQDKERLNKKILDQNEIGLLNTWRSRYSLRVVLCLLTCSLLYLAQLKYSQGYNLKLKMKQ